MNIAERLSRRGRTAPFIAMDVLKSADALEQAGRNIIHMEVGQPASPAPEVARQALADAMKRGDALGYSAALGRPSLRQAIARHYARSYGVEVDPARIIVTAGSSAGFILAFLGFFEHGARMLLGDPSYPSYRNTLSALGLDAIRVETGPETRYQPTPALLEAAGPAEGLLVASPANPTGSMLSPEALGDLAGYCRDRGMIFVSDEIYHGLSYGARSVSALEIDPEAVVINSFSKYFSMTGWRIGWMVVPDWAARQIETLGANLFICAPHASQIAAEAALEAGEELERHLAVYAGNRETLMRALPDMGIADFAPPDGAFYLYCEIGNLTDDSVAFCRHLLDAHGLAVTPGLDFDPVRGYRSMRLSFARSEAEIAEGVRRLAAAL